MCVNVFIKIPAIFPITILLMLSGCMSHHANTHKSTIVYDKSAITIKNNVLMPFIQQNDDEDSLNSQEGDICKIYDENTILTEDGREFTPFSAEIMNFFYPTNNVPEFEENENPQGYNETILPNVKLNFASLQKVLKLQAKERNFTAINERIKITPQFIVMTQTKQKLMMKMTIDF